ncbi:MAG TPA: peptide chain release factor 1, partial [Ktedonobacter sp.]|nr:peptide chain release factor 1 [Ktedonobacter sp.]
MDLIDKLASLAQRYEELNNLMAQPEVLEDIPLLQRYGREHAELEEVVNTYHEIMDNDRQIAEAQEMYEGDDPEMRDLAYEEMERLKARKEQFLEEVKISLLP